MPRGKNRDAQPATHAKLRDRKRVATETESSNGHQHSVNQVDLSTLLNLNPSSWKAVSTHRNQPTALNREQLNEAVNGQ